MGMKEPNWGKIGQQARRTRERYEWSQARVAQEAGVSQRLVSKIESGGCRQPSLAVLRVLQILDIAYTNLPTGVNEPTVRVSEDGWEEEIEWPFWVAEASTIHLTTANAAIARSLPEEEYDFSIRLSGPAKVVVEPTSEEPPAAVGEEGDPVVVTIRFTGSPDAKVTVRRSRP